MPSFFEIPFSPRPERFTVTLSGTDYRLTVQYRKAGGAGWVLDIADASDNPLVSGIPLVTGVDLLAQYKHLGFQGRLWVQVPLILTTYRRTKILASDRMFSG